ncbi:lysosome-associated membrane glycoprotein 5-like isoform X2 [Convolutriloba macropyga]
MTFDIEYFARDPVKNKDYIELKRGTMPSLVSVVGGRCMNETDTPYMYLQWDYGYYTLNITFHTHRHETGDLWDVHVVELTYDMNNTREFPYVAHPSDRTKKTAKYEGHLFETPVGMSYECSFQPTQISLTDENDVYGVNLYLRRMQLQPTQIFDNQFSSAKPCVADLEPQGPVYSPHLHTSMALVLMIAVFGMLAVYSFYKRYRAKILPIPGIIMSTIKTGDIQNAQLFPKEPSYE